MSFNKHFPGRGDGERPRVSAVDRAVLLRMVTWASLLMLATGYILMYVFWG